MAINFEALAGKLGIDVGPWTIGFAKAQATLAKFRQDTAAAMQAIGEATRQVSAGLTAIGVAVGAGSAALVKLASDAEESASKFQFVFKDAADQTIKTLDEFSDRAGRSTFKLRDMAASFGALLGPMGFTSKATGMLRKMGPDLAKAMKPGPGGSLNMQAATKMIDEYKAVLSTMPGFTAREFDRVALAIRQEMQKAAQVPPGFRGQFIKNIGSIVDGANKVFLQADAAAQTRLAGMQDSTLAQMQTAMAEQYGYLQDKISAATKSGTKSEVNELKQLGKAVIHAMAQVENATAKSRGKAIKNAQAMQKTFDKAFADIGKKGVAAFAKVDKAEQQVAVDAKKGAAAAGAAGAAAKPNAAGKPGAGKQSGGQTGGQQTWQPQDIVGQIGNALSGALNNAMGIVGLANSQLQQIMSTASPLQKLNTEVTSMAAQLQAATIDHVSGPVLDQMRAELSKLQHRRQGQMQKEGKERAESVTRAKEAERQQQMEHSWQTHQSNKDLNDNLSNLVIVGRRAVQSPVQITIEGVNDIRVAVDRIELEMKRRGWLPGHRNTLETRKMW